ncbi:MAG: hypothetical protein WCA39_03140, partial [Nitrososphaeraceae archaeon]
PNLYTYLLPSILKPFWHNKGNSGILTSFIWNFILGDCGRQVGLSTQYSKNTKIFVIKYDRKSIFILYVPE